MKRLICEMCGDSNLIKDNGVFVCQSCGCKYSLEEAKKMMVEGVVEVTGTVKVDNTEQIENMLVNARRTYKDGRYQEAQNLYKQVLAEEPNNVEAILFEGISVGWQGNLVRYTMQQATDATLRALQIANKNIEQSEELEKIVWKGLVEITKLGKAVVDLCEKSAQESLKRCERELESVKQYADRAGLYADFEYVKQRGDNAIAAAEADEKKYGEIKDNTYLLVLSVYEEALKNFKDVEKYELNTIDKITQKLKECKIDKNAYYKMTATKYQNVLEAIRKKRTAKEDYFRKLEEARVKQYWDEHKDEKSDLDRKLSELYTKKGTLIQEKTEFEKSIKLLTDLKNRQLPLEKELTVLQNEKKTLISKKSGLGLFKGKEKKALDEQIGKKEQEINLISEEIKAQRTASINECDSKISDIRMKKNRTEEQLKQIDQNIEEIKKVLKTANTDFYTKNTTDTQEKYNEEVVESFTQTKIVSVAKEDFMMKYLEGDSILTKEETVIMKDEWLKSGRISKEQFANLSYEEIVGIFMEMLVEK